MLSSAQFSLSLCPLLFRSLFLGVDSRELKFIRLGDSFHFMRTSAFKQMELFILNPPSVLVLSGWLAAHLVLDYRYFLGRIQAETFFRKPREKLSLNFHCTFGGRE